MHHSPNEAINNAKDKLQNAQTQLLQVLQNNQPVTLVLQQWCALHDELILNLWQTHCSKTSLGLYALGGFGRQELLPKSDIDLLILAKQESDIQQHSAAIQNFLHSLWDLSFTLGHQVRTLEDCTREGLADISVFTAMIEARTLSCDNTLETAFRHVIQKELLANPNDFAKKKYTEQQKRHAKFDFADCALEPDVKAAPGGLRDIHSLQWLSLAYFNSMHLETLVLENILTRADYKRLITAQKRLWQARMACHLLSGRAENKLLFDYQKQLAYYQFADKPQHQDDDTKQLIERYMARYYKATKTIRFINTLVWQHFHEEVINNIEDQTPQIMNQHFQCRGNVIELREGVNIPDHPSVLLEIFVLMGLHEKLDTIRAATAKLLKKHADLITPEFRQNPKHKALFMTLMRSPYRLVRQLRRMSRYGILGRYLPEFEAIIGQMQHDLFHTLTVDEHTLVVVRNVRRFRQIEYQKQYAYISEIVNRGVKFDRLTLAAFFHDIGKGRGGDHSEIGAKDAKRFCQAHYLNKQDTSLIVWLVENHLLMSQTAQKQDISDPAIIHEFAQKIGNHERLDHLYLLTIADINGTNPTIWNSWRGSLLAQLYRETQSVLDLGLETPQALSDRAQECQNQALELLAKHANISSKDTKILWDLWPEEYFAQYQAEEIAWHVQCLAEASFQRGFIECIKVRPYGRSNDDAPQAYEIFIYCPDQSHTFTGCTSMLDAMGLSILDARIMTSLPHIGLPSIAMNTFVVVASSRYGQQLDDMAPEHIEQECLTRFAQLDKQPSNINRRTPREVAHFERTTEISFEPHPTNNTSIITIIALDEPGLLSKIAQCFLTQNITVWRAKISTLGEKAEDIFEISNSEGRALTTEESQRLREGMEDALQP